MYKVSHKVKQIVYAVDAMLLKSEMYKKSETQFTFAELLLSNSKCKWMFIIYNMVLSTDYLRTQCKPCGGWSSRSSGNLKCFIGILIWSCQSSMNMEYICNSSLQAHLNWCSSYPNNHDVVTLAANISSFWIMESPFSWVRFSRSLCVHVMVEGSWSMMLTHLLA